MNIIKKIETRENSTFRSIFILKIRDAIKCTFEINGSNYGQGRECLIKLLSKQKNVVKRHSKQNVEVNIAKNHSKIVFYVEVKFTEILAAVEL